jgi:4-amino-4-deoxy-L-arabinose transferase-like glycosyltransferase
MTALTRWEGRPLLWILGLAFLIRIAAIPLAHLEGFGSDEKEYIFLAHQLINGNGFVDSNGEYSIKGPVFPMVVAVCFRVWPSSLLLPFLFVALVATLSVYVGYLLALKCWNDQKIALWAAGMIAFFPSLVLYGGLLMTESLFILLLLVTMLFGERLRHEDGYLMHMLFGIAAGLAVLTRAAAFGLVPLILLAIGVARRKTRMRFRRLLVAFGVWCLILVPWTVRNYHIHQQFIPVSTFGGRAYLTGNNPFAHGTAKLDPGYYDWLALQLKNRGYIRGETLTEARQISLEQAIGLEYAVSHPSRTLTLAIQKAFVFWIYPITYGQDIRSLQALFMSFDILLLLSTFCGVALSSLKRVTFSTVWVAIAFFTAMNMLLYAEARYRLPLLPFLCILGAGSTSLRNPDLRRGLFTNARTRMILVSGIVILAAAYGLTALLFLGGVIS